MMLLTVQSSPVTCYLVAVRPNVVLSRELLRIKDVLV
jgi:hypothetical protein